MCRRSGRPGPPSRQHREGREVTRTWHRRRPAWCAPPPGSVRPRRLSREASVAPGGGVLDRHCHLHVGRAVRRGRRSHADHAVDGEAFTNEATRQRAVRSVDRLCLGSALEVERQLAGGGAARGDDERRQVDRAVDRLVPLDVGGPVHLEGVDRSERGPGGGEGASGQSGFDRAALCLEAPNAHPEDCARRVGRPGRGGTRSGPTTVRSRPPRCGTGA